MIYEDALEAARTELEALLEEENAFQYRLNQNQARQADLNNTVESLGVLVGEEGQEKTIGLTEAMRQLYRNKEKVGSFTPMMMRAFLRKEEFPIDDYTNPLAVIHTTLKRLHAQNELQSWERHGKTWYRVNPDHVFIDDAYISF